METWWRELRDLDDEQRAVIALEVDGSFLVQGPPGSGKTNLLLLRANYLSNSEHANLAVIVFNRTLCEFIRSGGGRYDFDPSNVQTSHQFFERILREAHISYESTGEFSEDRGRRLSALTSALRELRQPVYDVILLDEAQDYLAGEIALFRRLARNLFMVADSRQQIYQSNSTIGYLGSVVDRVLPLRFHYRNGHPICDVADRIGATFTTGYDPILPTCNYNSPQFRPSVEEFTGDFATQAVEIGRRLVLQRRTYPEGLLGVICPRIAEVRQMAEALEAQGRGSQLCVQDREDGYQAIQATRPIWISTVHSAKGLEFRALHFATADLVKRFGAEQKRIAYTAVTRAKTSLVIYHENKLPGYLDTALNAIRPPANHTDLGAAFGRR